MNKEDGFTLIELSITVAIVGILAAIAVPAYHSYIIKAEITEGLSLIGKLQTDTAGYFNETSNWPVDETTLGDASSSGKYVTGITMANGVITITYGNQSHPILQGATLALAPGATAGGVMVWVCGLQTAPASATMAGSAALTTTVPPQYLPASCR